jgi:hypothetical protein
MQLKPLARVNPLAPKLSKRAYDNRVAWQWWVPTNTPLGQWRVRVNCGSAKPLQGTFFGNPLTGLGSRTASGSLRNARPSERYTIDSGRR